MMLRGQQWCLSPILGGGAASLVGIRLVKSSDFIQETQPSNINIRSCLAASLTYPLWLGVLDEVRTILLQGRSAFAYDFA